MGCSQGLTGLDQIRCDRIENPFEKKKLNLKFISTKKEKTKIGKWKEDHHPVCACTCYRVTSRSTFLYIYFSNTHTYTYKTFRIFAPSANRSTVYLYSLANVWTRRPCVQRWDTFFFFLGADYHIEEKCYKKRNKSRRNGLGRF